MEVRCEGFARIVDDSDWTEVIEIAPHHLLVV